MLIFLLFLAVGLNAQTEPRLVLPIGHTWSVSSIRLNPPFGNCKDGGELLLTTSKADNTPRLYDVKSGKEIRSFVHGTNLRSAEFSPDGRKIVTTSDDDTIRLWDVEKGTVIKKLFYYNHYPDYAAYSATGEYLLTASGSQIIVWDTLYKCIKIVKNYDGDFNGLYFPLKLSDNDRYLIYRSHEGLGLVVWDLIKNVEMFNLLGHTGLINSIDVNVTSEFILTSSDDSTVRVWCLKTGECINTLDSFSDIVTLAKFSPNDSDVLAHSQDNILKMINWRTKNIKYSKVYKLGYARPNIVFSNKGDQFLAELGNSIQLINSENGAVLNIFNGHLAAITDLIFHPTHRKFLSSSADATVKIWDIDSGEDPLTLSGSAEDLYSHINNDFIVSEAAGKNRLIVWDMLSAKPRIFIGKTGRILSFKDSFMISFSDSIGLILWNIYKANKVQIFKGVNKRIRTAEINLTKFLIATTSYYDSIVEVFDIKTGFKKFSLNGHSGIVHSAKFSPDGSNLVTTGDFSVRIWDVSNGKELKKISDTLRFQYADYGHNSNFLLTFCYRSVKIYNKSNFNLIGELNYNFFGTRLVSLFNDIKKVALIGNEYNSNLINSKTGDKIKHFQFLGNPVFSNDGRFLAYYTRDYGKGGRVLMLDLESGDTFLTLDKNVHNVKAINFSNDDSKIITYGADHKTIIWDASTGNPLYTRLQLTGNDWLVYDEDYRFDGTEGAINYLYFVCGLEVVELAQLKDSLWVPGLAEKKMNGEEILINDKPAPKLKNLSICEYTPVIETPKQEGKILRYRIVPRRGGLGNTEVIINGNPTYSYTPKQLEKKTEDGKDVYYLNLNTDTLQPFLTSNRGAANPMQVKAAVKGSGIFGRGEPFELFNSSSTSERPKFFGVFVGVNDYGNPQGGNNTNRYRDLTFAQKDAADMANAVEACARNLFDKDSCFVYRLTGNDDLAPTKENLQRVLGEIGKKARASDVLYIFFAGHGDLLQSDESKQIRFILQNGDKRNLKSGSFGTEDLTDWCHPRKIKAQKRVFVFDACHSGQFMNETYAAVQGRGDDEGKRIRQLDKLKDQNGMMILAAAAENESAYEDETLNQGVLTYHLLQTLKVQARDTSLTIKSWFDQTIKEVQEYSKENGQQQEPRSFGDGLFEIGNISKKVRDNIKIECPKKRFGRCIFTSNAKTRELYPSVEDSINNYFSLAAKNRKLVYSKKSDRAYQAIGYYILENNKIEVGYDIYLGDKKVNENIQVPARKYKSQSDLIKALTASIEMEIEVIDSAWRITNCDLSK